MKNILTAACLTLALTVSVFAIPTKDKIPENTALLSVSINTGEESAFDKALKEKGFKGDSEWLPEEMRELLKKGGINFEKDIKSFTLAVTVNQNNLPNGIILFADGPFDAKKVMSTLVVQDEIKEAVEESATADDDDATLAVIKAGLSDAIQVTIKKNEILKSDLVLTMAAMAPDTLVIADKDNFSFLSAVYTGGKSKPSLSDGPLVDTLSLGNKISQTYVKDFGKILAASKAFFIAQMPPEMADEISKPQPMFDPFLAVQSLKSSSEVTPEGSILGLTDFAFTSDSDAEAMQELLLGFKALAGMFLAQVDIPSATLGVINSIRVTASGKTVTARITATPDAIVALQNSMISDDCDDDDDDGIDIDDIDDIDTITEEEARKLLEEALKK